MNNLLLENAFKEFLSRLESAEKFSLEHAPDIAKDMVKEETMERDRDLKVYIAITILSLVVCVGLILLSIYCSEQVGETDFKYGRMRSEVGAVFSAIGAFIIFISAMVQTSCAYSNYERLQFVKTCPKLFILRSFRELLR